LWLNFRTGPAYGKGNELQFFPTFHMQYYFAKRRKLISTNARGENKKNALRQKLYELQAAAAEKTIIAAPSNAIR